MIAIRRAGVVVVARHRRAALIYARAIMAYVRSGGRPNCG
jgi:hypothetical protein